MSGHDILCTQNEVKIRYIREFTKRQRSVLQTNSLITIVAVVVVIVIIIIIIIIMIIVIISAAVAVLSNANNNNINSSNSRSSQQDEQVNRHVHNGRDRMLLPLTPTEECLRNNANRSDQGGFGS
uniref:Uncharacterized protein n=1 Tax=Anopheles maculatus TaxID=74869 RepID=A0A182SJI6_9DIPT